ncbi:gag polyprotein [Onchocerca flexuosa]|uniref:Gag polyprotein n=1 Tax=Onchocerca flexuosa TaxID=387005 RepID=A0A238BKU1_9BILA|nr:gag polyprotein [Onchocerca flexuosa]
MIAGGEGIVESPRKNNDETIVPEQDSDSELYPERVAEHIYDSPIIPGPSKNDDETIVLEQDSDSELSHEDRDNLEEQAFEYNKENWDAFIVTKHKNKDKGSPFSELKDMLTSISQSIEQLDLLPLDMLTEERAFRDLNQQLNYPEQAYPQINEVALKAWKKLPASNRKTEDLSKIRQGPDEPYQDFVARLLDAVSKIIGDEEAGTLVTKQMAYENANAACQAALRPYRRKGGLTDYIRICADIGPSYLQGLSMAAAIQGKTIKEILYQQIKNKGGVKKGGPPCSCFSCGQLGHRMAQCPKKNNLDSTKNPDVCPRCKKGRHWPRDCRSKMNIEGKLLPPQSGNWVRGQPQAPKQCYGALQTEPQSNLIDPALKAFSEPPQAAQDWTCVPPPTQY